MVGQDAILGTDFMVSAGIRLNLADGTLCLPDEVWVQISGRRVVHDNLVSDVESKKSARIIAGVCVEIPLKKLTL